MKSDAVEVRDLQQLRNYVHQEICSENELESGVFPMTERWMVRGGNPCGIYFCVHGPRSVKLTAIWESTGNSILFYDSKGERIRKAQLTCKLPLAS